MDRLSAVARAGLPAGRPLPEAAWTARHRGLLVVVHLHALAILALAWSQGDPSTGALWAAAVAAIAGVAGLPSVGRLPRLSRTTRACLVTVAVLACSAILINLTDGATEAHGHVFLALALVALYGEWVPYLLAIAFVAAHHLVIATIDPASLFARPEAVADPYTWVGLHVVAIAAASGIYLMSWRLAESERERTDRVLDATADAIYGIDAAGRVTFVNAALTDALATDADDLLGRDHHDALGHGRPDGQPYPAESCRVCRVVAAADRTAAADDTFARADGSRFPVELSASPIRRGGSRTGTVVTFRDLSERAALTRRALHDPLTGLPNRALLVDHLQRALARQARHGGLVGVLFVDLDRFKVVNDSLGHAAGDDLLVQTALRLRAALRQHDTVARFGGDEFVIVCDDLTDEAQVTTVAERIVSTLADPFEIAGQEVYSSASVGVTVARRRPDASPDAETVLADADAAMYRAKERGRNGYELFDEGMRRRAQARMALEADLRRTLAEGDLEVHYQPKVDLRDGTIIGVEALARWTHPERGSVPPVEFIPIAEETGLVCELGLQVLARACTDAAGWVGPDGEPLLISVNLSGRQLQQRDLADQLAAVLAATGTDPSRVVLEITETVLMTDLSLAVQALEDLKAVGVRIAVDDFGTGYSSLAYLTRFPVDILKVDRSFVDRLTDGGQSRSIVSAVIGLAGALGLHTIAEGVEDAGQLLALRELGCELAQGFHLARPMPAADLAEVLRRGLAWEVLAAQPVPGSVGGGGGGGVLEGPDPKILRNPPSTTDTPAVVTPRAV